MQTMILSRYTNISKQEEGLRLCDLESYLAISLSSFAQLNVFNVFIMFLSFRKGFSLSLTMHTEKYKLK